MKVSTILPWLALFLASVGEASPTPNPGDVEGELAAFGGAGRWTVKKREDDEAAAFGGAGRWTVKKREDEEIAAFGGAGRWTVKKRE